MIYGKRKNRIKNLLYSKVAIVVLLTILAFLLNSVYGVYKKAKSAYEDKEFAKDGLQILMEREAALVADIEKLKTDRGFEVEVRDRFGVVREGEEVVVVVDSDAEKMEDGGQSISGPRAWWRSIIKFFE